MKNKKVYKKIIVVLTLLAVFAALFFLIARKSLAVKKEGAEGIAILKEVYENNIEIAGTVSAAEEQILQAKSDGTVLGVYVKKGDKVKKGDIIIQLDSTEQDYNLAKLDYNMASTKISGSKKELELQQKERLSLLQKIEDRKVCATFDGIIADIDVSEGDSMEAKDSVGTLVNVDYLTAEVEIPETDVSKLKAGQEVEFKFPAYEGIVKGYVVSWPAIGSVTSRGATIVMATIRIDEYPKQILPNYSFTGKIIITAPVENLVLAKEAVAKDENGNFFVQEVSSDEKIFVKLSAYGNDFYKVESGLSGNEVLKVLSKNRPSGYKKSSAHADSANSKERNQGRMNLMPGPGGPR